MNKAKNIKWKPEKVFSYSSVFSTISFKTPRYECMSKNGRSFCGVLHKTREASLKHCKQLDLDVKV